MTTDEGSWPGFMAQIVDHLAHPVFVKDRAFRFVYVNRALCQLVGFPREQLVGKTDYDFFPKAEADYFRKKDTETFATANEVEIDEEPITDAAGKRHVLATTKVPLRGASGEVTHLVGIIHDITALKSAEDALRMANEGLERRVAERNRELADAQQQLLREERLAVLGRLVGGLAHQIRNPLGAIANAAAILAKALGPSASPEARQAVAVITEEVWRTNRIIVDLVDFARIRPAEPRWVEVAALVDVALANHERPPRIGLTLDLPQPLAVSVDREQMESALGHLISNALEAMGDRGGLSISARHEGEQVVIAVEDVGPGISPEVWAHLFEPLNTTKPFGLGLGLTTCRALVENQGGTVTGSTVPGKGTRFEVRLPAQGQP
ncbi:MAG: sensor histidine kinase [Myxococcaceae bacterium]|nr:sensor histidine kinase [Myxococcaceae bacterium]